MTITAPDVIASPIVKRAVFISKQFHLAVILLSLKFNIRPLKYFTWQCDGVALSGAIGWFSVPVIIYVPSSIWTELGGPKDIIETDGIGTS